MKTIRVTIPSRASHCSQIITGFHLLSKKSDFHVEFEKLFQDKENEFYGDALVFAEYEGKRIVYDTFDGYNTCPKMYQLLRECDFYFKRSFSLPRNQLYFPQFWQKIYPLGFNYHVSFKNNPIDGEYESFAACVDTFARAILGRDRKSYYSTDVFEANAVPKLKMHPRIIFLTRLWNPDLSESGERLTPEKAEERKYINDMRILTIRLLKERYGDYFVGGLTDCELGRKLAPDLILDDHVTRRKNYLKLMHESDICIGSMGLHESIGWKTGEYVAAGKAIVNEQLHYDVPGKFEEGKHYLSFSTADECLAAVERLTESPESVQKMKIANMEYYANYLRPDAMIENTLKIVQK